MAAADSNGDAQQVAGTAAAVDVHGHGVPNRFLRQIASRTGGACGVTVVDDGDSWRVQLPGAPTASVVRRGMHDPTARRQWLSERGISLQLLSPWMDVHPSPQMPAGDARDWARRLNEAMLVEQQSSAGVHRALATITLHDGDQAADDLREAIADQGMAGALVSTNPTEASLRDTRLEPLWAAAEELGAPIVLHPPTVGPHSCIPAMSEYGNAFGRLIDSTLAVSSLILDGLLDRHPRLSLVTVHGGGFLPYQAMRLDGGCRVGALSEHKIELGVPSAYLSHLYYDTVAMSATAIAFLVATVGADRVLLGSDYPFPLGDPNPVQTVRDAGMPAADTENILRRNASRLLAGGSGD